MTFKQMVSIPLKLRIKEKIPSYPTLTLQEKVCNSVGEEGKALLFKEHGLENSVGSSKEPRVLFLVYPLVHNWPFIKISQVDKRRYVSQFSSTVTKYLC